MSIQKRSGTSIYIRGNLSYNNILTLEKICSRYSFVESTSYLPLPFQSNDIYFYPYGRNYEIVPNLYGIPNNLYSTFTDGFTHIYDTTGVKSSTQLSEFVNTHQYSVILSTYTSKQYFITPGDRLILKFNQSYHDFTIYSTLKSSPIFDFSLVEPSSNNPDVLIGMPSLLELSGMKINDLFFKRFFLKIPNDYTNESKIKLLLIEINNYLIGKDAQLVDSRDDIQNTGQFIDVTKLLFLILSIPVLLLCFFSLLSTLITNIIDQNKEIAILRSIGLTKFKLIRIYIWESLSIVINSIISGLLIGILSGICFINLKGLLTDSKDNLIWPTLVICIVIFGCLLCGLIAPYLALRKYLNMTISDNYRSDQI